MINNKLIIAHRGASAYKMMNTIAAFKEAIEMKADMIEFDVRKTKDNIIILFHDDKINNLKVCELKFKEITKIRADIPRLNQSLRILKNRIKIDVHLKEEHYEQEVIKIILQNYMEKDVIICSEFPGSLKRVKEINEKIKTGLIMGFNVKNILIFPKEKFINYLMPRWQLVNVFFLANAKKYNKKIFPWVVNNKKLAKRLLKKDIIAGIITNIPDLMQN